MIIEIRCPCLLTEKLISIHTNKGILTVENLINENDSIFIMSPVPIFTAKDVNLEDLTHSLGISETDIRKECGMEIINAGVETLIVPINSIKCILSMNPDLSVLNDFCNRNDIDVITVYCDKVTGDSDYRTRVFAPPFGYLEDPATGSGNSAFGYYLLKHSLWDGNMLTIEQNAFPDRYNIVKLKTQIDENGYKRVLFGGRAIKRIEGKYYLK